MNQLIHTSPTLVLHQLGWGIPHAIWRNHAYAFYLNSITNSNGDTKFSFAWKILFYYYLRLCFIRALKVKYDIYEEAFLFLS